MPCDPKDIEKVSETLSKTDIEGVTAQSVLDDIPSSEFGPAMTHKKMGLFWKFRPQMGAFGDEFAVRVLQPIARKNTEAENFTVKMYDKYKEALKPLGLDESLWQRVRTGLAGIPRETDELLQRAVRMTDDQGRFRGDPAAFPENIRNAARNIRRLYTEAFEQYGIDPETYFQYRDLIRGRPTGILREASDLPAEQTWRQRLRPTEQTFYEEMERRGIISDLSTTATADYLEFLHRIANHTIRRPFIEKIEKELVNPYFDIKFMRLPDGSVRPFSSIDKVGFKAWTELKAHLYGEPAPMDIILTDQFKKLAEMVGRGDQFDPAFAYRVSQAVANLFYSGTLGLPLVGGRPGSVMRQFAQLIPTYAEVGAKNLLIGIQKAMSPGAVAELQARNILTSPIEKILESVSVARGVGRAISATTENSLRLFSWVDRFARAVTAYAKEAQFNDYLTRGAMERLPARRETREEIMRLVGQKNIEEARDRFMFDGVVNLQYLYGKVNRPAAFRGALGNLAGVFMSYPLNSAELVRIMTRDAKEWVKTYGKEGNPAPLLRLIGLTSVLMWAGSEFANVDLRQALLIGALPHSMAFPKMAIDAYNVAENNWEWITGNLFGVGETDYHRKVRQDAYREFSKHFQTFVPGGVFTFSDLPKVLDEGSVVRLLGGTPKADELNAAARRRARIAREQRQATGGLSVQGLGGL